MRSLEEIAKDFSKASDNLHNLRMQQYQEDPVLRVLREIENIKAQAAFFKFKEERDRLIVSLAKQ